MTWHTNKRPGVIPRAIRELYVGGEIVFRPDQAPAGKLRERVGYYIRKHRLTNKDKKFLMFEIERVGIMVTRVK